MDDAERVDDSLVGRALAGERGAFAELYDRYARMARAVVLDATNDAATAQDLTQECFLRAYRQLASLRQRGRFRFWLVGIARRVVREHRRRRPAEPLSNDVPSPRDEMARLADADEIEHVLRLVA